MPIISKKFEEEAPELHEEVVELEQQLAEKKKELARVEGKERHDKEILKELKTQNRSLFTILIVLGFIAGFVTSVAMKL